VKVPEELTERKWGINKKNPFYDHNIHLELDYLYVQKSEIKTKYVSVRMLFHLHRLECFDVRAIVGKAELENNNGIIAYGSHLGKPLKDIEVEWEKVFGKELSAKINKIYARLHTNGAEDDTVKHLYQRGSNVFVGTIHQNVELMII